MQLLSNSPVPVALPSPTLTNPDMILPDSSPSESSPSTPRQDQHLPFLAGAEGNGQRPAADEIPKVKSTMYSPFHNGILRRHDGSKKFGSRSERGDNRITFEKNRLSFHKAEETPIASSPTLQENFNGYGERIYTESTQGDYENGEGTYSTPAILEEDENDPSSHAAMTKRAEEILANAKRRLTNMEGNLNRARSTLQRRPSSSMSSFRNHSPEPVSLYTIPNKGRSPSGFSPSKHRQANLPGLDESRQGHARVFSETSVPSSLQTGLPNGRSAVGNVEVSSGLGISSGDEVSQERHSEPNRNWFWGGLTRNTSLNHANRHMNGLQALNEDGPAPQSFEQRAARVDDIEEEGSDDLQSPIASNFDAQHPPATGLTRAHSTNQMHDIREQMQDLKGKISTLKQRAREDNMRRRSEQSLRTPSPFTAAQQWYTGVAVSDDIVPEASGPGDRNVVSSSPLSEDLVQSTPREYGHASPNLEQFIEAPNLEQSTNKIYSEEIALEDTKAVVRYPKDDFEREKKLPNHGDRVIPVDGPVDVPLYGAEGGRPSMNDLSPVDAESREDSLYGDQDYHETSTSPIVERHEDRPDAFDYEHSVLNSAFGAYSGVGVRRSSSMRKRTNSESSESSVETTKPRNSTGEASQDDNLLNGGHGRQNSVDSVSTDNTFATADEGNQANEGQDRGTYGHAIAESRYPETMRNHISNGEPESVQPKTQMNDTQKSGSKRHIASAHKEHPDDDTRSSPPVQNGALSQTPDLLTVLSATDSWQEGAPPLQLNLGDRDRELVERLVKSLAKVCSQVHTLDPKGGVYEARVFRRKLDAARRVLDGEMNGEAF